MSIEYYITNTLADDFLGLNFKYFEVNKDMFVLDMSFHLVLKTYPFILNGESQIACKATGRHFWINGYYFIKIKKPEIYL